MSLYCILSIQPLILNSLNIRYLSLPQTSLHATLDMVPLRGAWTNTDQLHVPSLFLPTGWNCDGIFRDQFLATGTTETTTKAIISTVFHSIAKCHALLRSTKENASQFRGSPVNASESSEGFLGFLSGGQLWRRILVAQRILPRATQNSVFPANIGCWQKSCWRIS